MCCTNVRRESWVIGLILIGFIISLGVSIPMLLITYPGTECLLFVSVRGEALIYGHPSGCNYITGAHFFVILSSIVFLILFVLSRRQGSRPPGQTGSMSIRSLRGSIGGFSQLPTYGRAKVTVTLVILTVVLTLFVLLTAIINLSGYLKTCGELQIETRRNIHSKSTLGFPLKNFYVSCFSLYRDTNFHSRFHNDHYELNGQWFGQYTVYRHHRPKTWTGSHEHFIPLAVGMEISLFSSILSAVIWIVITILVILLRKNLKGLNKREIAESIEDARIWAADMASLSAADANAASKHQYEMVSRPNNNGTPLSSAYSSLQQHQSISTIQQQAHLMQQPPQPPVEPKSMLEHQEVIAQTHAEGSFFMTQEGQYVQLINGVLTNVDITPMMQGPVQYSELAFQQQQQYSAELSQKLNQLHQQQVFHEQQQNHPQPQQHLPSQQIINHHQKQNNPNQTARSKQPNRPAPVAPRETGSQKRGKQDQLTQPLLQQQGEASIGGSSEFSNAPTVSHLSGSASEADQMSVEGRTRMQMRMQADLANDAGIRCSQL